jgi:hypothetical protein
MLQKKNLLSRFRVNNILIIWLIELLYSLQFLRLHIEVKKTTIKKAAFRGAAVISYGYFIASTTSSLLLCGFHLVFLQYTFLGSSH